jgi:uncharacterized protein
MRVNQIPEEGKEVALKVDVKKANKYFSLLKNSDFSATSDVEGKVRVWSKDGMVIVEGEVSVELDLTCSRCLTHFRYPVYHHFRSIYSPFHEMCKVEDLELKPYDMDVSIYNGVELDLENVLYEQVFLGMPDRALCCPDCKGLCPTCGANLNEGPCRCESEPRFSPFDVLKNLKLKG